jgi:hypothetical protein
MHILFNGCSYTWGDELEHREQDRFSTLVSNYYKASYNNISDCGRSNDAITRTTMEWFTAGNTCDLAIIQWTIISRIEGYNPQEKYVCVTTQTPYKWREYYTKYYHDQLGVDNLFKNYYLLEQYFIQQKIPYLFLLHDDWNKIITTTDSIWKQLIIKKDLHFLRGNLSDNDCILDLNNNIKPNKGHPNPLGHQKISQHIIDTIGTLQ